MVTKQFHFCWICGKDVYLEKAKTDEHGNVVHEMCYSVRMSLKQRQALQNPQVETFQTNVMSPKKGVTEKP